MTDYSASERETLHRLGFSAVVSPEEVPAPSAHPDPEEYSLIHIACGNSVKSVGARVVGKKLVREFRCNKCNITLAGPSQDLAWREKAPQH